MTVRCNAGTITTNQMGWLGDYPEPVWYNPTGIANILSLANVKKYYHVTYDSKSTDTFMVNNGQSQKWKFCPSKRGLYYVNLKDIREMIMSGLW